MIEVIYLLRLDLQQLKQSLRKEGLRIIGIKFPAYKRVI